MDTDMLYTIILELIKYFDEFYLFQNREITVWPVPVLTGQKKGKRL